MTAEAVEDRVRRPKAHRVGALLVGSLAALVLLEAASAALDRLDSGAWSRPGELEAIRQRQVDGSDAGVAPAVRRARRLSRAGGSTVLHPFLGYVPEPALETASNAGGLGDLIAAGSEVESLLTRSPEALVVAVFGGSVANVLATEHRDLLRSALEGLARDSSRELEIVSVASGGYKQPQQLMALNYLLVLGASFDVVIELDGFNEVALPPAELSRWGVFPLYPRNWPLRAAALEPSLVRERATLALLEERRSRWMRSFDRPPLSLSFLGHRIWRMGDERIERRLADRQVALLDRDLGLEGYQTTGPRPPRSEGAQLEVIVRAWSEASESMAALCAARGIWYVHLLQPNQYVDGSKPLTPRERRTAFREDHRYRPGVVAGYPKMREACERLRQRGIPCHDATDLFAQVDETVYVDDCCHLNARGNELLAVAIARALEDLPSDRDRGGAEPPARSPPRAR
ncbi:MAG TPA: hypothetical protein VMT85_24250 [Thermoanaerobaculia bacterium]|nr:hypothetical protein [Thermoanaerobaculia bacterium]